MKTAPFLVALAITIQSAPSPPGGTSQGALCQMLLEKKRRSEALTIEQQEYGRSWCRGTDPFILDGW